MPHQKQNLPEPDHADFATTRTGDHYIGVPHWSQIATTAEKKDIMQGHADRY